MVYKVKKELELYINSEKAKFYPKFFKAFKGGYGEGDKFIGVTVPNQRKVAKKFHKEISLKEIESLLKEEIHEYRQTSLFMLTYKYENSKDFKNKKEIVDLYLRNTSYINNWDLVDSTAYKILGDFLLSRDKDILYELSNSSNIWEQRISIISTLAFIKAGKFKETIKISEKLLNHNHDLIHKAVGWMLREVGKIDYEVEYNFLKKHYKEMPRTMLRYSIEKFDEKVRQNFLKGKI
jgi:3-methyladenine DNA glycosylase AlkD